jgi:uncharacterized protein (DUF885 family)
LVLHEAVPGHIFEGTLARALKDVPEVRRFAFSDDAYVEGWALYAETLGSQLGVYRNPYTRYGQLAAECLRAVRLVVETGIHARGWTRDQAHAYFREHVPGESPGELDPREVDRYIAWPGQALTMKIGERKIRSLRTLAERRLGSKFDVREFHDVVLCNGRIPLEMLEQEVQEYIQGAAARQEARWARRGHRSKLLQLIPEATVSASHDGFATRAHLEQSRSWTRLRQPIHAGTQHAISSWGS